MRVKPPKKSRAQGEYVKKETERALVTLFKYLDPGMLESQVHPLKFLVIKTKI